MNTTPPQSERTDIAPVSTLLDAASIQASIAGHVATIDDAVNAIAEMLNASHAPIIVGLTDMTIEGVKQAITLGQTARAVVALDRLPCYAQSLGHAVTMTGPENAIYAWADLVLLIGDDDLATGTINKAPIKAMDVPATIDEVAAIRLALKSEAHAHPVAEAIKRATRVAVAIDGDVIDDDPRIASQWHALAAETQQQTRMCVIAAPMEYRGMRQAFDTITWMTGLAPIWGAISFTEGQPKLARHDSQAASIPCDLIFEICTSYDELNTPDNTKRIRFAYRPDNEKNGAAIDVILPADAPNIQGHFTQADSSLTRIAHDPTTASPDPAVVLLQAIAERLAVRP